VKPNYRQKALSGIGASAIMIASGLLAPVALAQESESVEPDASGDLVQVSAPETEPEDDVARMSRVVVSGSRVIANGYEAPTPVTTTTNAELKAVSPILTDALRQLPQLSGSSSAAVATHTQGAGPGNTTAANLRDLGPERTLVLLDGRRTAPSMATGTADMALFPSGLVEKVDIVTGGASAAYGSGAVSGVVNYVLNTDFEGVQAEVRGGISGQNDAGSYGFDLTGGKSFNAGKGHVVFDLSGSGQAGLDGTERGWSNKFTSRIVNPNAGQPGEPTFLIVDDVSSNIATFGGLIRTPGPLFNTNFDADGNAIPFGTGISAGGTQIGGDGARYTQPLRSGNKQINAFVHAKYDLTDDVEVFAEGSYGVSELKYPLVLPYSIGGRAYTIQQDNAYLPESVRDVMIANDIESFSMWKYDLDYGRPEAFTKSNALNATFGLKAQLPFDFELDTYYSHGETLLRWGSNPGVKLAELKLSADAVIDPDTGQIVCRSTLTDPTNGCVARNPFGIHAPTEEQAGYVLGQPVARSLTKQDVFAATVTGSPFSTWAGEVPIAVGVEYRNNTNKVIGDAVSQQANWAVSNVTAGSRGSYDLFEGFVEALVPLVKDAPFAEDLSLNAAIRHTNYSTSGGVTSWKVGLTNQVFEDLRLRATVSRDIRAPHIGELFGGQTLVSLAFFDPVLNNQYFQGVISPSGSNPDLTPELSDTLTLGFVYRPSFIDGFGLSVDYYSLKIEDAISQLSAQTIINQCVAGDQSLCDLITRNPTTNEITQIYNTLINIQTAEISGVDFEASYSTDWLGGDLSFRGVASYLDSYQFESPGSVTLEQAGWSVRPHWRGNASVSWSKGPWTATVSERILGESYRLSPPDLTDQEKAPLTAYTNLYLQYAFGSEALEKEVFLNISNVFDQDPQALGTSTQTIAYNIYTQPSYYDMVGRYFSVGARVRF
jgi:outer membrane receptor protein involved in Fe transport